MIGRPLRAAELLLKELGVTEPSEIDVTAIAAHVGASVKVRRLSGCEARIVGLGDRAVISISEDSSSRRKRFSTGHELGHWHHHRGRDFDCRTSDIGNVDNDPTNPERQADDYAADLLMPWYLFEPAVRRAKQLDLSLLDGMVDRFDTSHTATAIRLIEANIEPAIVASYTSRGRRWFRASKDVPSRWFPTDTLDPDTYAYDVLKGDKNRSHMSAVDAEAWFDVPGDRYEVKEQSMKLFGDEILVILRLVDEEMQGGFAPRATDGPQMRRN